MVVGLVGDEAEVAAGGVPAAGVVAGDPRGMSRGSTPLLLVAICDCSTTWPCTLPWPDDRSERFAWLNDLNPQAKLGPVCAASPRSRPEADLPHNTAPGPDGAPRAPFGAVSGEDNSTGAS